MSVNVRIPTPLRKFTNSLESVAVEGATVGEALQNLAENHPGIKQRLFTDEGKVRRFVNIFANEEDIRFLEQLDTTLEDGDELAIVPAIAGGAA
jgi:molybdopterin synthase sulfur carrier subunit